MNSPISPPPWSSPAPAASKDDGRRPQRNSSRGSDIAEDRSDRTPTEVPPPPLLRSFINFEAAELTFMATPKSEAIVSSLASRIGEDGAAPSSSSLLNASEVTPVPPRWRTASRPSRHSCAVVASSHTKSRLLGFFPSASAYMSEKHWSGGCLCLLDRNALVSRPAMTCVTSPMRTAFTLAPLLTHSSVVSSLDSWKYATWGLALRQYFSRLAPLRSAVRASTVVGFVCVDGPASPPRACVAMAAAGRSTWWARPRSSDGWARHTPFSTAT